MPTNPDGKRGLIFDEAHERSGAVRFNNIAGEEHAQCTSNVEVHVIRTVEEMFGSKTSTKFESSTSQVGPELDVSLNLNAVGSLAQDIMQTVGNMFGSSVEGEQTEERQSQLHGSGYVQLCAGGSAGYDVGVSSGEVHAEACGGGEIGGSSGTTNTDKVSLAQTRQSSQGAAAASGTSFSLGASAGIGFTIPPIWKSLASSNERDQKIVTSIDSKQVTTTKATTHCKRYSYQLQHYSPLAFHTGFKRGLAQLNQCWNAAEDANPNSYQCARNFINAYGTHFVKRAIFGAKVTTTRILDFEKANKQSRQALNDCTRSQSTWSALGLYTDGDTGSQCQNDLSSGVSISHSGLRKEHTESVGCKPSVDYGDDGPFPPEIIDQTLAPISDLFTPEFMTEERIGTTIDFEGIRPWLADKILDYCVLFKSEHHCKHTTR